MTRPSRTVCCILVAFLLAAVGCGKSDDDKLSPHEAAELTDDLRNIGLGLHNYNDQNQKLPAAAYPQGPLPLERLGNATITPWRVAILPFIEEDRLFKDIQGEKYGAEFWKNADLLAKRPKLFGHHSDLKDKTLTRWRVFVGNGAAWEKGKNFSIQSIPDGSSNTILVVEAEEAVPWASDQELEYDPTKPLPRLGDPRRDFFLALMADGSVRRIPKKTDEATIRAMITRAGAEPVDLP